MSYTKIFIHTVWATKNREPVLNKEKKDAICWHIREYAKTQNIYVMIVNGWQDHLHCLISMSSDENVAKLMNLIKGESSYWANKNLQWNGKFGWQNEYFAISVSPFHLDTVYNYIAHQEEHHRQRSFQEEFNEFARNIQINLKVDD